MNIKQIYLQASATINNNSDLELLLSKAINKPRVYLYSHPEKILTPQELSLFNNLLARHQEQQEPIEYILGEAEFYGLKFFINPAVLIPRPETEVLINFILEKFTQKNLTILELGTGSGVIAISLAKHRPHWDITALDISSEALDIAKKNAEHHQIPPQKINWLKSNWYQQLNAASNKYDLIISNPPYISESDPHLKNLTWEPALALISGKTGMDAIAIIIQNSQNYLKPGGLIVLEHGYNQAELVQACYLQYGFQEINTLRDLSLHPRITFARKS